MSEERLSLAPGATLHGTYVLESPLGRGGMGAVWRARHARLPRPVAIKVLHEDAYESEELLLRFRREAEITSQLGHPHIVEVFDFNVLEDGRAYLVMELLEGTSLRERLRAGSPLTQAEILTLVDQVGSALAHAHRAGVVHRDLKPENIFLVASTGGDEGRIHAKVLDFGISKMHGAHTVITQGASLMGTPRYMSPEQARGGTADVDGRADQFSLGAIAYEMLAGRPAFAGESVTQVLLRVLEDEPEPLADLAPGAPAAVRAAIERALSKHREARFSDLDAFRRALAGAEPSGAGTPPPRPVSVAHTDPDAFEDTVRRPAPGPETPPPAPPPRRSRAWWSVPLVLLAGAGGLWWGLEHGPGDGGPAVVLVPDAGRRPGAVDVPAPNDARPAPAASAPSDGGAEAAGPDALDAGPDALDAGPDALDAGPEAPPVRRPIRPKPLPPRLQGAETALRAGDYDRAIREANRSLREEDDRRAHGVAAIAYCGKRDLAAAKARLRQTPLRARGRVRRACARLGMDL